MIMFDPDFPDITYTMVDLRSMLLRGVSPETPIDAEFPDGFVAHFTVGMLV